MICSTGLEVLRRPQLSSFSQHVCRNLLFGASNLGFENGSFHWRFPSNFHGFPYDHQMIRLVKCLAVPIASSAAKMAASRGWPAARSCAAHLREPTWWNRWVTMISQQCCGYSAQQHPTTIVKRKNISLICKLDKLVYFNTHCFGKVLGPSFWDFNLEKGTDMD